MSRRADRWWRPATTRRPPLRARQRQTYTGEQVAEEVADGFELGYRAGQGDERKHASGRDDLLDVADAAGATPLDEVNDSAHLPDEVERWLRDQG